MSTWRFSDRGRAYNVTANEDSVEVRSSGSIVEPQWVAVMPFTNVIEVTFDPSSKTFTFSSGQERRNLGVAELEESGTQRKSPFEEANDGEWILEEDKALGTGRFTSFRRRSAQVDDPDA